MALFAGDIRCTLEQAPNAIPRRSDPPHWSLIIAMHVDVVRVSSRMETTVKIAGKHEDQNSKVASLKSAAAPRYKGWTWLLTWQIPSF